MRLVWVLGASATVLAACHVVSGLDGFVERDVSAGGGTTASVGGGGGPGGEGGTVPSTGGGGMGGAGGAELPCTAPGTTDVPCTGDLLWSKSVSAAEGNTFIRGMSIAADGSIYLGGYAVGMTTFDGQTFGETGENGWVLKLDDQGNVLWRRQVTGNLYEIVTSVAATPDGGVVAVGEFWGQLVIEGGPTFDNPDTSFDNSFIVRYDAAGAFQWARHFSGQDEEALRNVAVDASGRVVVVGEFEVEVNVPGGPTLTEAGDNGMPRNQIFVAMRNANGGHLWANAYGSDAESQEAYSVSIASDGDVIVGGDFYGSIDFGLGALVPVDEQDAFVVKLDADDGGAALWQTWVKGDDLEYLWGVDVCPDGSLAVAGGYTSALFVGDGPDHAAIDDDIWHARLSADGVHVASEGLPGTANDVGYNRMIRCDPDGRLVLAGTLDGTNPFGVTPDGGEDGFVAKLDDEGGAHWVQRLGGAGFDQAKNLSIAADGGILVTGNFDQEITLGETTYPVAGGGENAFLVKLAP